MRNISISKVVQKQKRNSEEPLSVVSSYALNIMRGSEVSEAQSSRTQRIVSEDNSEDFESEWRPSYTFNFPRTTSSRALNNSFFQYLCRFIIMLCAPLRDWF